MKTYKTNSINQETNKQTKGATLRANFSGSLRAKEWSKTFLKVLESQNMQCLIKNQMIKILMIKNLKKAKKS